VRFLADVARKEVRLACGIFGSTREEVGGSETCDKAPASGRRWMPPAYLRPKASGGGEALALVQICNILGGALRSEFRIYALYAARYAISLIDPGAMPKSAKSRTVRFSNSVRVL
jgi:hypothetical protein